MITPYSPSFSLVNQHYTPSSAGYCGLPNNLWTSAGSPSHRLWRLDQFQNQTQRAFGEASGVPRVRDRAGGGTNALENAGIMAMNVEYDE